MGEPISIDLVNTRVRRDGASLDLIGETGSLAAWLAAEGGRIPWSGDVTDTDLLEIRSLRDAIAQLFAAWNASNQPSPDALSTINSALSASAHVTGLAWTTDGPQISTDPPARSERDALLCAIAMDAVNILTGTDARLLRTCEHPDCTLQFLAHNPRRRWCSAAICGNRARVARHYTRHHTNS
jgi:predicted RNA-binding Zn ribbon-like protein